jgi:beta-glucosidase
MAATFNKDLVQKLGSALGAEAKLKNVGVLLGPTINIHRHPYGMQHMMKREIWEIEF